MGLIFNNMPLLDGYLRLPVTTSRNVMTSDKGYTLIPSNNVVLTFPQNLWKGMGFYVVTPPGGSITFRSQGTLLNYGTTDIIRSSTQNLFCQILQIDINSYLISGM